MWELLLLSPPPFLSLLFLKVLILPEHFILGPKDSLIAIYNLKRNCRIQVFFICLFWLFRFIIMHIDQATCSIGLRLEALLNTSLFVLHCSWTCCMRLFRFSRWNRLIYFSCLFYAYYKKPIFSMFLRWYSLKLC